MTTALTLTSNDILEKAKEIAADPLRFAGYSDDPIGFCHDVLGVEIWDKQ